MLSNSLLWIASEIQLCSSWLGAINFNTDDWQKFNLSISGYGILYHVTFQNASKHYSSLLHRITCISEPNKQKTKQTNKKKKQRDCLINVNELKTWYDAIWPFPILAMELRRQKWCLCWKLLLLLPLTKFLEFGIHSTKFSCLHAPQKVFDPIPKIF